MEIINTNIECPQCRSFIIAYFANYSHAISEDEYYTDSELEWECPNGCLFDDDELETIDEKVERFVDDYGEPSIEEKLMMHDVVFWD